jgi:hypothetical protein
VCPFLRNSTLSKHLNIEQGVYAAGSVQGFGQIFVRAINEDRDKSFTGKAIDGLLMVCGLESKAGTLPGMGDRYVKNFILFSLMIFTRVAKLSLELSLLDVAPSTR